MDVLGSAASVVAVVDISAKVASLLFQYSKEVKGAKEDISRVQLQVESLKNACDSVLQRLQGPDAKKLKASQKLLDALRHACSQLNSLEQELSPRKGRKAMSRIGIRALKWPLDSKDVEKTIQHLNACSQAISLALQADQMATLLGVDQKILAVNQNIVLDKLPVADGAAFDSQAEGTAPICHPDTRVDLLRQIHKWADQPADQPQAHAVYWLKGMAGTGKSTISRTVARQFADQHRLGASFFFKRGDGDRGKVTKFFTTIASQLVSSVPALAVHVKNAIESDPGVTQKNMQEQFEKLIFEPLSKTTLDASQESGIVIVVDALDECDRDDDVKLIINLFSRVRSLTSLRLRILVTSRPELPIRLGFGAIRGKYQDLVLHEIPEPILEQDISAYLQHELGRIRDDYNTSVPEDRQLSSTWPDQSAIQILVKMAVPLFIFAATACRFIDDRICGDPDEQLQEVLNFQTRSQQSKLDATYLPVLNKLLVRRTDAGLLPLSATEKGRILEDFQTIVGSIVVLASPLSAAPLARLLDMSQRRVEYRLDLLHSVLSVPRSSSSPVRLLHLSFRDFLVDPDKRETNQFWVNEQQTHKRLATDCLRVMKEGLRTDICGLQAPGTPRSSISAETIEANLPPELQYACLYWVYHVEQSQVQPYDGDQFHDFLCHSFLQWLEALSFMGRALESVAILKTLRSRVKVDTQLSSFLEDALRLVLANAPTIDSSPLQLYSSVLAFAPQKSIIRGKFEKIIPDWIELRPDPETSWSQCLQVLEGHSSGVYSVAFSHDSALVASASWDKTVRVWRSDTGECVQEDNMGAVVTSLSFSPDSTRLLTNLGAIALPKLPFVGHAPAYKISVLPVGAEIRKDHCVGYGFSEDLSWITWYGKNMLWLPVEFRPVASAVSGCMVVIGCNSGRVIFIRFNTEGVNGCLDSAVSHSGASH